MLNVCYVFIEFKKISSYNSIYIELLAGGGECSPVPTVFKSFFHKSIKFINISKKAQDV